MQSALLLAYVFSCASATTPSSSSQYTWTKMKQPTGCPTYQPTSTLTPIPASTSSGTAPLFTALVDSQGTVASQFFSEDANSNSILFSASNSSRYVWIMPAGHRAVLDNHGARVYKSDCSAAIQLSVPNFLRALKHYEKTNPASKPKLKPRQHFGELLIRAAPPIDISINLQDQCGNPLTGHSATAECTITYPGTAQSDPQGQDEPPVSVSQQVALTDSGDGDYTGSCTQPDVTSDHQQCEDTAKGILDWPTSGLVGQLPNGGSSLKFIGGLLGGSLIARGAKALAGFFELPGIITAIGALSTFEVFVASGGDQLLAGLICAPIGYATFNLDVDLDVQNGAANNYQTQEPFTGYTTTQTVTISSSTTCTCSTPTPPCQNVGYSYTCGSHANWCYGTRVSDNTDICYENTFLDVALEYVCNSDADCTAPRSVCITACSNCCYPEAVCVIPAPMDTYCTVDGGYGYKEYST